MTAAASLTCRTADETDLDQLTAFEQTIFAEDPWTRAMLAEELASPSSRYAVAEADGVPVGYAGIKVAGDQADVMTIGVLPHCRGMGVGALLLDDMLAWVRSVGVIEVFLDVRPSNDAAIGLYASRGFEAIGRRPRYFRNPVEDAVLMRVDLRESVG